MSSWEHFSHDADIGIRGIGKNIEEAFEMAAMALTAVITSPEKISPIETVYIYCNELDIELLFYDWMNSLIYEMDTKKILFNKFRVHINRGSLEAECKGQRVNLAIHDPAVDIKGATMTELKVTQIDNQWIAQCIVDV